MCLAQAALLTEVSASGEALATVDGQVRRVVLTALDEPAEPGDWVLVQAGFAMSRLSPAEATELIDLLNSAKEVRQ